MIIGICGKSGCGKSTLANQIIELTDNKAIHLDIDKVGHRVLLLPEVQEELGGQLFVRTKRGVVLTEEGKEFYNYLKFKKN